MKLQDWHRVGKCVVCIDDSPVPNPRFPKLSFGHVYTIAKVHVVPETSYHPPSRGDVFLGVTAHPWPEGGFCCWEAERFRPCVDTDISVFESALTAKELAAHD